METPASPAIAAGQQTAPAPLTIGAPPPPNPVAEREEIARLAYFYWEARGRQGGSAEDDWLRAERELLKKRASAS